MNLKEKVSNIRENLSTRTYSFRYRIYFHTLARISFWKRKQLWKIENIRSDNPIKTIPIWGRLVIELQSNCNRDCYFCPRHRDRSGVRKDANGIHIVKSMPSSNVYDIIDQAVNLGFKGSVGFHRLSEPFLDNRYIKFATYAKEKGMIICEHTNGDVLKKNLQLCEKLDGLIDVLTIGLYDYKNKKERMEQMRFWKNRFSKTKVFFSLPLDFPEKRQNTELYDGEKVTVKSGNIPCFSTFVFQIRYDGEVSLCCEDDQCNFNLGNVFDSSIKDIWWSEKHIKIVNSLKSKGGRNLYPLCKTCVFYPWRG